MWWFGTRRKTPAIPMVSFGATRMSLSKHPRLRYHVGWFLQNFERSRVIKDPRSQRRQLVGVKIPARSQRCVRKQKKHTPRRRRPQAALRDAQSRQALWSSASSPSSSPLLMSPSSSELWGLHMNLYTLNPGLPPSSF